jgi:hypothetical protein
MSYESSGIKRAYNEPALCHPKYERYDMSVKCQFSVSLVCKVTRLFQEC